jgi:hypothetical protein
MIVLYFLVSIGFITYANYLYLKTHHNNKMILTLKKLLENNKNIDFEIVKKYVNDIVETMV